MTLPQGEEFDNLFHTFNHTAFHLELKDSYHVPEEADPFELFRQGKSDDFSWHQPWLRLVRAATHAGKSIRRVRVVTVPQCRKAHQQVWALAVPHDEYTSM